MVIVRVSHSGPSLLGPLPAPETLPERVRASREHPGRCSSPWNFAQLVKVYRASTEGEHRYSPPDVVATELVPVMGNPDPMRICTSHVEPRNLTMRMQVRRLTRLTNALSKKWDNLWAALCPQFAYYNFCRIHQGLRVTPAMEVGIADRVWTTAQLIAN